jgi:integrase
MSMGRKRTSNFNLPPRMHLKGGCYYHVSSAVPRKWTRLDPDPNRARILWATLENEHADTDSFQALADRYMAECTDNLAPATQKQYGIYANTLAAVFGNMPLSGITPQHIAKYLDEHRSPTMANNQVSMLAVMFEKAMRWGWIDRNPARGIRRNSMKPRDRYITDDEFRTIREAAPDFIRCAMDICYVTGMRQGDILKIKLSDITADGLMVQQGKTGKKQCFTLSYELSAALNRAKALPHPVRSFFLLSSQNGQPYKQRTFQQKFLATIRETKIENIHFHDIRAKAATDAKKLGQDYQALLGHANRTMSDRYVKLREVEQVEPLRKEL